MPRQVILTLDLTFTPKCIHSARSVCSSLSSPTHIHPIFFTVVNVSILQLDTLRLWKKDILLWEILLESRLHGVQALAEWCSSSHRLFVGLITEIKGQFWFFFAVIWVWNFHSHWHTRSLQNHRCQVDHLVLHPQLTATPHLTMMQ
jgi:hypothetical protein